MKELKLLLTEASKITAELTRLEQMEAEARAAIVAATDEDVTLPSAQKKIADARLTLELVSVRRSKLKPPFSALHARLQELFRSEARRFNDRVAVAREAKEAEVVRANLSFWDDNEKLFRKSTVFDSLPVFHAYRKAIYTMPFYPDPKESNLVRDVKELVSHITRHEKALGLS